MNPDLESLLERARELYDDLDLAAVRSWKAARPDRKAVGHLPVYVPRELIHAAGMLPVGIVGAGDRIEIIRGDAYFQSYICQIPRSTIEMGLSGRLDALDGMLFPSICDVIRNLSGMWRLMFSDRYVRYVDVPQNFDPAVGGEFWRRELESLWEELSALSSRPRRQSHLRDSIEIYNRNRRAVRRLYHERSQRPWVYPISEVFLVLRAGNLLPPDEHTEMLTRYLELAAEEDRQEQDLSRVVLVGMFCEQPPLGLLLTLERAGCWIVDDDLLLGLRWLRSDVEPEGDALHNLALAYLEQSVATASVYQPEGRRGGWLVDSVRDNAAEGVIFCAPSFCDPALLEQPMLVAALERAQVPYTQFKYSENTGQFAVIREQAGTFSDSIRLWSDL